jgi:hypothetical protein
MMVSEREELCYSINCVVPLGSSFSFLKVDGVGVEAKQALLLPSRYLVARAY